MGTSKLDWSINLCDGNIHHGGQEITYGYCSREGDTIECICDRENGTLYFVQNGRFLGNAYQDDNLKRGDLYFALGFSEVD